MIRLRKHIAVLLFGIFFFPIVFQSAHIVWHHSRDHEHKHLIGGKKYSSENQSHALTTIISQKDNLCPICEYQFSSNDRSDILILKAKISEINCVFNEIVTLRYKKQDFSKKPARAPPVSIS